MGIRTSVRAPGVDRFQASRGPHRCFRGVGHAGGIRAVADDLGGARVGTASVSVHTQHTAKVTLSERPTS